MTITATRAQYVINQARHNAEVLQEPVAIAVVDRDAQLIGCIRSEKASTTLLDHAVRLAISASKHHFAPTARSLRRTHAGTRLLPTPDAMTLVAAHHGVLAVAAATATCADDIARATLHDVVAFDERHRRFCALQ